MGRFIRESFRDIVPYTPGEQPKVKLIKLNTNENPMPPSPQVKKALLQADKDSLRLYSDLEASKARDAIADYYGLEANQVTVTNGSDEALAFAFMAFCQNVVYPDITYSFYPVFAQIFGCRPTQIPLNADMEISADDYIGCKGTVLIANPNAPTGIALPRDEIEKIVRSDPGRMVIIDEAYVDFGAESCVPLIKEYDNILVIQTMSKSRSLAGMRIGFAMGCSEIMTDFDKMKYSFNPYNVNTESMIAAEAAMKDKDYFDRCMATIMKNRAWLVEKSEQMGIKVLPSKANFIFAKTGAEYFHELRKHDIIVRHWDKEKIKDWVRISIGTAEDLEKLVEVTKEIL